MEPTQLLVHVKIVKSVHFQDFAAPLIVTISYMDSALHWSCCGIFLQVVANIWSLAALFKSQLADYTLLSTTKYIKFLILVLFLF